MKKIYPASYFDPPKTFLDGSRVPFLSRWRVRSLAVTEVYAVSVDLCRAPAVAVLIRPRTELKTACHDRTRAFCEMGLHKIRISPIDDVDEIRLSVSILADIVTVTRKCEGNILGSGWKFVDFRITSQTTHDRTDIQHTVPFCQFLALASVSSRVVYIIKIKIYTIQAFLLKKNIQNTLLY